MRLETGALVLIAALGLAACNKPQVAKNDDKPPANSEIRQGLQEKTVPGAMTTNVVARTGTMATGTANSSTVAGAPPPGTTNPANAH